MSTPVQPGPPPDPNPFVGPRALRPGEAIYGRDREIRRLVNLLVAERIVLLYSPSGAGKTSLIEAGLIPRLVERRFQVSPVIRVSLRPPEKVADCNRYLVSTLQSLEAGLRPRQQRDPQALVEMGLERYLREWGEDDLRLGNELLIFDQFEEVLVLDPGDDSEKREFFHELGAVLEERGRWALFSMREDYIAGLDPYLSELPTRLHTRMRLDLLSPDNARQAAEKSAAAAGRPFQDAAVATLVDGLRRVQAQRDGQLVYVPGPVVEPLQLQVVCRRLWESLAPDAHGIDEADVARLGRIQDALADYYAREVRRVAQESGVPERSIRDWFGEQLMTDQGVRRQQQGGPGTDPIAAQAAAGLLEDAHLVRSESRRGTRWLELAHDQLVEPIRENNAEWRSRYLNRVQQQARHWVALDRPRDLLMVGRSLSEAEAWAKENPAELTELETSFLTASAGAEAERRRRRQRTIVLRWLSVGLALALVVAGIEWRSAVGAKEQASTRSEEATSRAYAAEAQAELGIDSARAAHLSEQGLSHARTQEAEDAMRAAMSQNLPQAVLAHGDNVDTVAFNPDGDRVITSSWDRTVRIWETRTGAQLHLIPEDSNPRDARFSPDGDSVLILTDQGVLTLWRADDPTQPIWQVPELSLPLTFSHDGTRVLAADSQQTQVQVLDAKSGQPAAPVLAGHSAAITSITTSMDDSLVLTASGDGTARVWDSATGQQRAELPGHEAGAAQAAFRRDTRAIATGDGHGAVRIWQWPELAPPITMTGQEHGAVNVAFAPTGQLLAYGDKSPRLFDSSTGQPIATLAGHRDWVQSVQFSEDGRRAVTASLDGTARVWDMPSGRELTVMRSRESVFGARISTAGDVVAAINGSSVRIYPVPQQTVLAGFHDWVLGSQVFPDGAEVAAGGQDGRVLVWDVKSHQVVATLLGPSTSVQKIGVDPTGRYVSAATSDGSVWIWDWRTGQVVAHKQVMTQAVDVSFDSSGTRLVVTGDEVVVWKWQTDEEPMGVGFLLPNSLSLAAAFSPDGRSVAYTNGAAVELRSLPDGGLIRSLFGHTGNVRSVAYSKDGRHLVTSAEDGTAKIWQAAGGALISTLEGHRGTVPSAAFNDRGDLVVTGGDDGSIGVWDASSGRKVATVPGHADVVNSVHFFPGDAPNILSASDDSTVQISECEACQPLDALRTRAAQVFAADGRAHFTPPRVGQCFTYLVQYRSPADCQESHFAEVFAVLTPRTEDGASRLSDVLERVRGECQGRLYRDYRGKDAGNDPDFYAWVSGPATSADWDLGQHTFACVLSPSYRTTTTGSARSQR